MQLVCTLDERLYKTVVIKCPSLHMGGGGVIHNEMGLFFAQRTIPIDLWHCSWNHHPQKTPSRGSSGRIYCKGIHITINLMTYTNCS